ncbi:MAG: adenosine deaminase [Acidobacteriia bacterium]|nr:adenosine deaminase [Terriglobia bacterium]
MRLLILTICASAWAASPVSIEQRFAQLKKNPPELYQFLLRMPKGGDLHNHLSGAVYAESYIAAAAEDGLCADMNALKIVVCAPGLIDAQRVAKDNTLRNTLIDALSMRNFVPGRESGHDHFFATFGKFGPIKEEHRGEFLAEVVRRAADQNESYLEVMAINGRAADALAAQIGEMKDYDAAKDALLRAGLDKVVEAMRARVAEMDRGRVRALGCDTKPDTPACRVVVRYLYEVIRESPLKEIFAEVLAGCMLTATDPLVVGINFVAPEDGLVSMRDYHEQMRMVGYAKHLYPKAHVSLHAGELAPGLIPPEGLRFHIREAVELGHAERIGHGVDILYETGAAQLLETMRDRHIMVEINLSSNDLILGVRGKDHPLPSYRKAGVPVALATDDEGVSRGHLTLEYVRAALDYGLTYAELKKMARNSLEYSFLPEDEKARAKAELERRFAEFEKLDKPRQ